MCTLRHPVALDISNLFRLDVLDHRAYTAAWNFASFNGTNINRDSYAESEIDRFALREIRAKCRVCNRCRMIIFVGRKKGSRGEAEETIKGVI